MAALEGLLHGGFRYDTVFFNDIDQHVPLTAVADSRIEEEGDQTVCERSVRKLDHGLVEEVDLLELVPESGIVLGELELFNVAVVRDFFAEDIEGGEDPATAALLLIGDSHGGNLDRELELRFIEPSVREGNVLHVVLCEGVGDGVIQRRRCGHLPECVNGA